MVSLRRIHVMLLVLAWAWYPLFAATPDNRIQAPNDDFLIVGHMGAPHEEPENTLESFNKALDLGANAIETDISLTKDGHLVLWHDWDPDQFIANYRQIGKQGLKARPYCPEIWKSARRPVPELTLAELRAHYGYTLRERGLGTTKKLPHRIPTLEEFLQWAVTQDRLKTVMFDVKIPADETRFVEPYFDRATALLKKYDFVDRAIFLVPSEEVLKKAVLYKILHGLHFSHDQELPGGIILHPKKFSTLTKSIKYGLNWGSIGRPVATLLGYSIYKKIIAYDLKIQRLHNFRDPDEPIAGVIAWTINKPAEMKELIGLGVRGILTDRPDLLKNVVDRMQTQESR